MLDTFHRYAQPYIEFQKLSKGLSDGNSLRILDVGANGIGVGRYLSEENVDLTLFDIKEFDSELKSGNTNINFVVGIESEGLPFEDGFFDLVVSIDVLEHVPKSARKSFMNELVRVSKNKVVVVFPEGKSTIKAEKVMSYIYLRRNVFLSEHEQLGLPEIKDIELYFGDNQKIKNLTVKSSLNLFLWFPIKIFSTILTRISGGKWDLFIFQLYRKLIFPVLNFGPTYGKCTVVEVGQK
mgnify:CR=1 FL=1